MELTSRLDPDLVGPLSRRPVVDLADIPNARSVMSEWRASLRHDRAWPGVSVEDHWADGLPGEPKVRVRHYRPVPPRTSPAPCMYWIHGGGHVMGDLDQDDAQLRDIVDDLGCAVVAVDWRLAPEHPFPASMNDCYAGLSWLHGNAEALGVDSQRIAVGGASSGGGSAAGLALLARDRGELPIRLQLLVYPMLDDRNVSTPAGTPAGALEHPRIWNIRSNTYAWRAYLGGSAGSDATSPYAAPARAADLAGLPPAVICVGELDLFTDEDIEYGRRLLRAGVPTELHVYPGAVHGFEKMAPDSRPARQFVRDRDDALRYAFGGAA